MDTLYNGYSLIGCIGETGNVGPIGISKSDLRKDKIIKILKIVRRNKK